MPSLIPPDRIPLSILDRRALVTGGAAAGSFGLRSAIAIAQGSETVATPDQIICVLTPEMTEGPFYVDDARIREDITDGESGLPLALEITVVDTTTCEPLPDAAVDIWHCNAQGAYSGVQGAAPGGNADVDAANAARSMFLRGTQLTDARGAVRFTTIYPGWYQGRTVHIHMKVILGGEANSAYDGGTDIHTGQLFFNDVVSDDVFATHEAYAGRNEVQRTRNDEDGILAGHEQEPGFFLDLTPVDQANPSRGYAGTITVGVHPT